MARDFSSGSGSVLSNKVSIVAGSLSLGAWVKQSALGGPANFAMVVQVNQNGVGDVVKMNLYDDPTAGNQRMEFNVGHATTDASRLSNRPLVTTGIWQCWVGTTDGSTTIGNQHIYYGTQALAMTNQDGTGNTPAGAQRSAVNIDGKVGNYWGLDNNFPGVIAQPFIVPWQMTLDECERYRQGDWTVLYEHGRPVMFLPLTGAALYDLSGSV